MLVKVYAGEISKTWVRASLLDPGIVRTRLCARAFPGEDPSRLPPPESVADAFLTLALPECMRKGEVVMPPPLRCDRMSERGRIILAPAVPPAPILDTGRPPRPTEP